MIPSVVASQVRATVLDYLQTTFSLSDRALEEALFTFLDSERGLFRGPFVDLRLPFEKAAAGAELPINVAPPFTPYAHQLQSWQRLSSLGRAPQPTLVTTGTGSGKTECFLYPILDHCVRHREEPGVKAILLYPMNALASDQARRLAKELHDDPELAGISAGLYVGGKGSHASADREHLTDDRNVLRKSPPDILLTNYRMLDFMLLRPEDRELWQHNGPDTLRYLVLDELHTYDGAQGSDVACLIRRLRARLQIPEGTLCPIGTSATLGGETVQQAQDNLIGFATQIFGSPFEQSSVIVERRQDAATALGTTIDDELPQPSESDADQLDPERAPDVATWLRDQARLWLGDVPRDGNGMPDPLTCGTKLREHSFLRQLLRLMRGQPTTLADLDHGLCEREEDWASIPPATRQAMLDSFLALVSWARRKEADVEALLPFLTVQVQLWLRELRRLVVRVAESWSADGFAWSSEQPTRRHRWLPLAFCRECGLRAGPATSARIRTPSRRTCATSAKPGSSAAAPAGS